MNEKSAFSQRLLSALKQAGATTLSPTKLAIDFNLHYRGKPVSTQAAHKWLNGTAIPSQDKIRTIASWLRVSPEWLRYGDLDKKTKTAIRHSTPPYPSLETQLLADFRQLNVQNKEIALELFGALLRLQSKSKS